MLSTSHTLQQRELRSSSHSALLRTRLVRLSKTTFFEKAVHVLDRAGIENASESAIRVCSRSLHLLIISGLTFLRLASSTSTCNIDHQKSFSYNAICETLLIYKIMKSLANISCPVERSIQTPVHSHKIKILILFTDYLVNNIIYVMLERKMAESYQERLYWTQAIKFSKEETSRHKE